MSRRTRTVVMAVAAALLAPLLVAAGPADPAGAAPPAPVPTAARDNDPSNIYAVGDSITTATGTGNLGAVTPANSWVTGTNGSVNSMRARLGLSSGAAVNLADNGERMQDFDDQANQLPSTASYVVVELGGNDLCRPSAGEMTSIASYRQEFLNGLAAVRANAPNALIFVASIPDIYNLWYIRGADDPYNPNPSPRREGAHFYWDFPLIDIIPCQSLVADPTDSSAGATARRLAVRQRNLEFNQVIAEECGAVLRCRTDDGNLFELSSNRIDPYANVEPGPNGYVPFGQRIFTDNDISYNSIAGCPASDLFFTGCGDHFHPSLQGQGKLAESGHLSSFQFPDNSFPDPILTPQRAPDGGGKYHSPVTVDVTATDAEGVRGFEYRVHHPDNSIDPWTEHIGTSFSVPVTEVGTTHVEARAMDINGNLSASEYTTVVHDPSAFSDFTGTVLEEGTGDPLSGVTVDLHGSGASGVLLSTSTDGSGAFTFPDLTAGDTFKLHVTDGDGSHLGEWAQNAATHGTADAFAPTATPEIRLEAAAPALSVSKALGAGDDAVNVGETIDYTVTVSNTGNVPLSGVTLSDPNATCEAVATSLAVGASDEVACTHGAAAGDVGSYTNTATGDSAETPPSVSNTVSTEVTPVPAPALSVSKTTDEEAVDVGEAIDWTITVSNDGNVPLTGVAVSDPAVPDCAESVGSLAVDASTQITCSYVTGAGDAGLFENTATADSDQTGVATSETTQTEVGDAVFTVGKEPVEDAVAVGGVLEWEITITNTGDQGLTGISVDDPTADSCSPTTDLDPTEQLVVECTQAVTAGDAGRVDNTATVDSDQVGPVAASAYAYACEQDFSDVGAGSTFFLDVCWLVGEGVTTGFPGGTYRPAQAVTRQAMAAFLYRMAGEPAFTEPGEATFRDVAVGSTFFTEIEWANDGGIISGFGGRLFKPGNVVTRQAMAAFMYRLAAPVFTAPGTASFPDVPTGHQFFTEIEWLAHAEITTGFSGGDFRPGQSVTRQSMAAFLHRLSPLLAP